MLLSQRLRTVMWQDEHQQDGCYEIRSLYFDDIWDSCIDENEAGVDCRKKYRIRTYDASSELIKLEIKEKINGLTKKHTCSISREEYNDLLDGGRSLDFDNRKPLNELLLQMRCAHMRPRIIITYERTAFVHPTGNVRITFDRNIKAIRDYTTFFDKRICGGIPVLPTGMHVLEVKYDEFLPDIIARQLENGKLYQTAFSKYFLGRMTVNGELYEDTIS